jgi:predicted N-acetyltransferase YhbS
MSVSPPTTATPASVEAVIDLTDRRPPSGRPMALLPDHRLITVTGGDRWIQAEAFVYETYLKIGFTGPSARKQVEELSRWADDSRFHLVVDGDDRIIGSIRTILGNFADLPVASFDRSDHLDLDPVCELSSLVVDPSVRSTGVVEHLYRAGWRDAWQQGATAVVAIIDDWLFEVFRDTYRLPFRSIGEAKPYMGGVPLPVSLPLRARAYDTQAAENPEFWAWTLEGISAMEFLTWELPVPGGHAFWASPGEPHPIPS